MLKAGRRCAVPLRSAVRGSALVELMATATLVALLTATSAPRLGRWLDSQRARQAADLLAASIRTASAMASAYRAEVMLEPLPAAGQQQAVATGWQILLADGRNGQLLQAIQAPHRCVRVMWGADGGAPDKGSGRGSGRGSGKGSGKETGNEIGNESAREWAKDGQALRLAAVGYSRSRQGGFVAATFTVRCGTARLQVRLGAQGAIRVCMPGRDRDCGDAAPAGPQSPGRTSAAGPM
ncbi:pilus assembly FimT family protein [Paracidovorax citrulli]